MEFLLDRLGDHMEGHREDRTAGHLEDQSADHPEDFLGECQMGCLAGPLLGRQEDHPEDHREDHLVGLREDRRIQMLPSAPMVDTFHQCPFILRRPRL